jgi:hypothetical protein
VNILTQTVYSLCHLGRNTKGLQNNVFPVTVEVKSYIMSGYLTQYNI